MNKKYFVASDIHNGYSIFKGALDAKGFDIDNPDHILVVCGDAFDRLKEARELLKFLIKIKELGRLIYIMGNHDLLIEDCWQEIEQHGLVQGDHHYSNGTVGTIAQLTNDGEITAKLEHWRCLTKPEQNKIEKAIKPLFDLIGDAKYYLEKGDYIFVHGWIPLDPCYENYYSSNKKSNYIPEWRELPRESLLWCESTWIGYPFAIKNNCLEKGKTIVCGHWHASYGWSHLKRVCKEFPQKNQAGWQDAFKPFVFDGGIAIDGCTAYSGIVNVLVFEENEGGEFKLTDI